MHVCDTCCGRFQADKCAGEEEEDDVFLYDNNIPSIPSLSTHYGSPVLRQNASFASPPPTTISTRNKLLWMISDRKCYNPRILKSLSFQKRSAMQQNFSKSSACEYLPFTGTLWPKPRMS